MQMLEHCKNEVVQTDGLVTSRRSWVWSPNGDFPYVFSHGLKHALKLIKGTEFSYRYLATNINLLWSLKLNMDFVTYPFPLLIYCCFQQWKVTQVVYKQIRADRII